MPVQTVDNSAILGAGMQLFRQKRDLAARQAREETLELARADREQKAQDARMKLEQERYKMMFDNDRAKAADALTKQNELALALDTRQRERFLLDRQNEEARATFQAGIKADRMTKLGNDFFNQALLQSSMDQGGIDPVTKKPRAPLSLAEAYTQERENLMVQFQSMGAKPEELGLALDAYNRAYQTHLGKQTKEQAAKTGEPVDPLASAKALSTRVSPSITGLQQTMERQVKEGKLSPEQKQYQESALARMKEVEKNLGGWRGSANVGLRTFYNFFLPTETEVSGPQFDINAATFGLKEALSTPAALQEAYRKGY